MSAILNSRVDERLSRLAHNQESVGSNPTLAPNFPPVPQFKTSGSQIHIKTVHWLRSAARVVDFNPQKHKL